MASDGSLEETGSEATTASAAAVRCVSVVIPNWNGADLLAANLPATIEAARAHPCPAEVIVVDDGSEDGSREVVRGFPEVRLVEHPENRGFAAACLTGTENARHGLVFLLNSDATPDPGALGPLSEAFDAPETFAASPLVLNEDGGVTGVTISVPYIKRGRIRYRPRGAGVLPHDRTPRPAWYTMFPLGGALMVDRRRFLELGGFDELYYPFYYEDVDLGFCAWRRGWSCLVVPESRVTHSGAATIGRSFPRFHVRVIRKRNRILFHCKNLTEPGGPWRHIALQGVRSLLRLFRFEGVELCASLMALPRIHKALARRRREIEVCQRSESEILALIEERWQSNLRANASAPVGGV